MSESEPETQEIKMQIKWTVKAHTDIIFKPGGLHKAE